VQKKVVITVMARW